MWDKIVKRLSDHNYSYTRDQVEGRWKSLKRAYKVTYDHNNKSGNDPKAYDYEELEEVFRNDPALAPKFTLSSSGISNSADISNAAAANTPQNTTNDEEGGENADAAGPSRPKKRKSSDVVDVFNAYLEDQKEEWRKRENQHNEKLGVFNRLIDALTKKDTS